MSDRLSDSRPPRPEVTEPTELVTWHGRIDWTDVRSQHHRTWITEKVPAGETPWTWQTMPWHPTRLWLPHRPVRRRRARA